MMQNTFHLLSSQAHWQVNKKLAKLTSVHAAILASDLISKRQWFIENMDIQDGWFYNTVENIEADTSLSSHQQREAVKQLENLGVLKTEYRGIPRKRYFFWVDDLMLKILTTSGEKIEPQAVKKLNINKNKETIINNDNKEKGNVSFSKPIDNVFQSMAYISDFLLNDEDWLSKTQILNSRKFKSVDEVKKKLDHFCKKQYLKSDRLRTIDEVKDYFINTISKL